MGSRVRIATNNQQQPIFSEQEVITCGKAKTYNQGCVGGFAFQTAGRYASAFGVVEEICVAQLESHFTRIVHLAASYYLISNYSVAWWLKIHFLPHVVWFPICFMINRCGQHYCCNPKDSALQSTITIPNLFWDWAHNYSEYHVEHHTFGEVPCYNLKYLHERLAPRLFKKMNIPRFYFKDLVWGWLVQNRKVYTVWYDMAIPWE